MAEPPREQTGVLVLRAWVDSLANDGFRARITTRLNVEKAQNQVHTTANVEGVLEIVRDWLQALSARA